MRKTVPCKWCKDQTYSVDTKCCDRCYELARRIRFDPEIAQDILNTLKKKCFFYIRAEDGGYNDSIIHSVDELVHELGWMDKDCAKVDRDLTHWMASAEVGAFFGWRLGTIIRLKDSI
jgi:hypothetical protein